MPSSHMWLAATYGSISLPADSSVGSASELPWSEGNVCQVTERENNSHTYLFLKPENVLAFFFSPFVHGLTLIRGSTLMHWSLSPSLEPPLLPCSAPFCALPPSTVLIGLPTGHKLTSLLLLRLFLVNRLVTHVQFLPSHSSALATSMPPAISSKPLGQL